MRSARRATARVGVRATLPGARNYYLRCEHSDLPRSELVPVR